MIKIKRGKCPKVLVGSPKTGTHYNKKKVVKELWEMQNHKCCYCESLIPEEGHQKAVEHFQPKSIFKWLKNDWNNLLLACPQCNGKKSNKFPIMLTDNKDESKVLYIKKPTRGKTLLIDPSKKIDPENHITFIVDDSNSDYGNIKRKNYRRLGKETIQIIGLNGSYYLRERRIWHRILNKVYNNLLEAEDQDNENAVKEECVTFKLYMSAKSKFAAYVREYVRRKEIDKNFDRYIPKVLKGAEV